MPEIIQHSPRAKRPLVRDEQRQESGWCYIPERGGALSRHPPAMGEGVGLEVLDREEDPFCPWEELRAQVVLDGW